VTLELGKSLKHFELRWVWSECTTSQTFYGKNPHRISARKNLPLESKADWETERQGIQTDSNGDESFAW
jgi:hypothetical protein